MIVTEFLRVLCVYISEKYASNLKDKDRKKSKSSSSLHANNMAEGVVGERAITGHCILRTSHWL